MAALMGVGMVTVWLTPEPGGNRPPEPLPGPTAAERVRAWLRRAVVAPTQYLMRNGTTQLLAIGLFIVLYKFGDALAGSISTRSMSRSACGGFRSQRC